MLLVPLVYLQRAPSDDVISALEVASGAATADDPSAAARTASSAGYVIVGGTAAAAPSREPVEPAPKAVPSTTATVAPTTTVAPSTTAAPTTTAAPRPTTTTTEHVHPSTTTTTTTAPPPTTVPPTTTTTALKLPLLNPSPKGAFTHRAEGVASWFGAAPGTCAHVEIPKGTVIKVTRIATGVSTTCVVDDWGPADRSRIIDLSDGSFKELAPLSVGLIDVVIEW